MSCIFYIYPYTFIFCIVLNFIFVVLHYSICVASYVAMNFLKSLGCIVNVFHLVRSYFMRLLHATNLKIDIAGVELFG